MGCDRTSVVYLVIQVASDDDPPDGHVSTKAFVRYQLGKLGIGHLP